MGTADPMTNCPWCDRPFKPKPGKKFCRTSCKDAFHRAVRLWMHKALDAGLVSIDTLRAMDAPYTAN